eukprot:364825-Chlamydomonas_euryale.AAC.8
MPHIQCFLLACWPHAVRPRTSEPRSADAMRAGAVDADGSGSGGLLRLLQRQRRPWQASTRNLAPPMQHPPCLKVQLLGSHPDDVNKLTLTPSSPTTKLGGVSDVRGRGQQPWRRKLTAYAALASAASRSGASRQNAVYVGTLGAEAPLRSPPSAPQMLRGGRGRSAARTSSADALQLGGGDACSDDGGDDDDDDGAPDAGTQAAPLTAFEHVPAELLTELLNVFGSAEGASAALRRLGDGAAPPPPPPPMLASRKPGMMSNFLARTPRTGCPRQVLGCNTPSSNAADPSPTESVEGVVPNRQNQFSARLMKSYEKSVSRRSSLAMYSSADRTAEWINNITAANYSTCTCSSASDSSGILCRPVQPSLQLHGTQALGRMRQVLDVYSVGSDHLMEQVVARMRSRRAKQVDMPLEEMEAVIRRLGISGNGNTNSATPGS